MPTGAVAAAGTPIRVAVQALPVDTTSMRFPATGAAAAAFVVAPAATLAMQVVLKRRHRRRVQQAPRCRRVVQRVLPDGTNEEGEDLKEPLTLKREELRDVVLYGNEFSPPCQKIITLLSYYEVPFNMVKGRHPTSDYKKIPVLELNGQQVNDSHVIVNNLVPVLTGEPLAGPQKEWERRVTFEFQPSLEVELFGDGSDLALAAGLQGFPKVLAGLFAPLLGAFIGQVFRSRYGDFPPTKTWGVEFREAFGGRPFFHGDAPGPIDLSVYGTYSDFARKGCRTSKAFLEGSGLEAWHEKMRELVEPKIASASSA